MDNPVIYVVMKEGETLILGREGVRETMKGTKTDRLLDRVTE